MKIIGRVAGFCKSSIVNTWVSLLISASIALVLIPVIYCFWIVYLISVSSNLWCLSGFLCAPFIFTGCFTLSAAIFDYVENKNF